MVRSKASTKTSAGLLMCRLGARGWEFLLAHPGGPFFARKDEGAWSIPKGLVERDEDLLRAARREFVEETSFGAEDDREYLPLGHVTQSAGKVVHAWAFIGDCDPASLKSNTCFIEWPPRSGRQREIPEIDRVAFFSSVEAMQKLNPAQVSFIERALVLLESLRMS